MKVKSQSYYERRMQTQLGIIKDMGYQLNDTSVVMDLGCGDGNLVNAYRNNGLQAFGCDFQFKEGPNVAALREQGIIREIDTTNYRLPFDDNSIDFLVSDQVFEHVRDYEATLHEIRRVLKPGGTSLHFFPSRYVIIEPHVHVPFASVIQKKYWLKLWAGMGIKTEGQKGLTAAEIAEKNYKYLNNQTHYLSKAAITKHCRHYFNNVRFCEDLFFKYIQRAPALYKLSKVAFFLPTIYSTMKTRVLFFSKS
jgi:ubiquinone/menaquinone biosynthesis C-methylase UbiE